MKLIALLIELQSAARQLATLGERVDIPARARAEGPPVPEEHRTAPQGQCIRGQQ